MKFLYAAALSLFLAGCSTVQHEVYVNVTEDNGLKEVQDAGQKIPALSRGMATETNISLPCLKIKQYEATYQKLCSQQYSGKGAPPSKQEKMCGELETAIERLASSCSEYSEESSAAARSLPPDVPSGGINVDLRGANAGGNIQITIQPPQPPQPPDGADPPG